MALGTDSIVAVDVGGTYIRASIVDGPSHLIGSARMRTPKSGVTDLLAGILWACEQVQLESGFRAGGLAVAMPCVVTPESGVVLESQKMCIRADTNFQSILSEKTGLRVIVRTELSMAALGQMHLVKKEQCDNLVVLTVGTGLGAGVVIRGSLYLGAGGRAGEIGHFPVATRGTPRKCSCGRVGCLEAYAASYSVTRSVGVGPWATSEEAVLAAEAGDVTALNAVQESGAHIGLAMALCANAYDPTIIVLRGGFVRAIWSVVSGIASESFSQVALGTCTDVRLSAVEDNDVLVGLSVEFGRVSGTS